jgi:hypothetical protein
MRLVSPLTFLSREQSSRQGAGLVEFHLRCCAKSEGDSNGGVGDEHNQAARADRE